MAPVMVRTEIALVARISTPTTVRDNIVGEEPRLSVIGITETGVIADTDRKTRILRSSEEATWDAVHSSEITVLISLTIARITQKPTEHNLRLGKNEATSSSWKRRPNRLRASFSREATKRGDMQTWRKKPTFTDMIHTHFRSWPELYNAKSGRLRP
jgi:hypothetical protein